MQIEGGWTMLEKDGVVYVKPVGPVGGDGGLHLKKIMEAGGNPVELLTRITEANISCEMFTTEAELTSITKLMVKTASEMTPETTDVVSKAVCKIFSKVKIVDVGSGVDLVVNLSKGLAYQDAPRGTAEAISVVISACGEDEVDQIGEKLKRKIKIPKRKASFGWFAVGVVGAAFTLPPDATQRKYFSTFEKITSRIPIYSTLSTLILTTVTVGTPALQRTTTELLSLLTTPSQSIANHALTDLTKMLLSEYSREPTAIDSLGCIALEMKLLGAHYKTVLGSEIDGLSSKLKYVYPTRCLSVREIKNIVEKAGPVEGQDFVTLYDTARGLLLSPSVEGWEGAVRGAVEDLIKENDVDAMTKSELTELAVLNGVKFTKNIKKDELKKLILDASSLTTPNPLEPLQPTQIDALHEAALSTVYGTDKNSLLASYAAAWEGPMRCEVAKFQLQQQKTLGSQTIAHKLIFMSDQLTSDFTPRPVDATVGEKDLYTKMLHAKGADIVGCYKPILRHLVGLFTDQGLQGAAKKKAGSVICSQIDVDPAVIEHLWPAIGQGLKGEGGNKEVLLDVLSVVLTRMDRFDAYMEAADSQETNPPGKLDGMYRKMLNMMLHLLETTSSTTVAKKAIKAALRLTMSPFVTPDIHRKLLSQAAFIHHKAAANLRPDLGSFILSLLTGKTAPEGGFVGLVEGEVSQLPLYEFPIGHAHAPSKFLQDFTSIFGSTKYDTAAKEIAAGLMAAYTDSASSVSKGLVACCVHLLSRSTKKSIFEKIDLTPIKADVLSFLKNTASDDDAVAVFVHGCQVLATLDMLPATDGVAQALCGVLATYNSQHSPRVLSTAVSCLAAASTEAGRRPVEGNFDVAYAHFLKVYCSVRYLYLEALRQQKMEVHPQIIPHVLRGMYVLSLFVLHFNWTKTAIAAYVKNIKLEKNELAVGKGVLNNVYGVLSDLVRIRLDPSVVNKVMVMQLRLLSALCARCANVYFNAAQNLIATALKKDQADLKAAALSLIRDFLTDEERRVEAAGKRVPGSGGSVASSPGSGKQEDSGIGNSLMQKYLSTILGCLFADDAHVRNVAMELVTLCYHQGLSIPMLAIEDLIATAADPSQMGLSRHSIDLLQSFTPKFSTTIVAKAAGGVFKSFVFLRKAVNLPPDTIRGYRGVSSVHAASFDLIAKTCKAGEAYAVQTLRLISQPEKAGDVFGEVEGAGMYFPRFVGEVLGLLQYKREAQVYAVIEACAQGVAVGIEEVKEELGRCRKNPSSRVKVVYGGLCLVVMNELSVYLKKDYGLTAVRKKKDEPAKSKTHEAGTTATPHFIRFLENTNVIQAVCTMEGDKVTVTTEQVTDLYDTLSHMALEEAESRKKAKKPAGKRGKKRRASTEEEESSSEDTSDDSTSSAESGSGSTASVSPPKKRKVGKK